MLKIEWIWKPNSSVGLIKLGDKIEEYLDKFGLILLDEHLDATGWIRYKAPDIDTYIDTEDGVIVSISSYETFLFNNKNLVGMDVKDLNKVLGCSPDEIGNQVIYEDGDVQIPYEYSDLGLQLWISNGKVALASCIEVM